MRSVACNFRSVRDMMRATDAGCVRCHSDTTRRLVAPRLFCDICDVFDAHDTDDCPQQAMSSSPQETHYHGSRHEHRDYCDICEGMWHLDTHTGTTVTSVKVGDTWTQTQVLLWHLWRYVTLRHAHRDYCDICEGRWHLDTNTGTTVTSVKVGDT